jgi:hypothetical protein
MSRTAARRELGFVVALAVAGLALVLVVVFAPWYTPAVGGSSAEKTPLTTQLVVRSEQSPPATP